MTQDSSMRINNRVNLAASLPLALVIAAIIFALGFALTAWRLASSPDVFTDEIAYTRVGIRVASEGALTWDTGVPFYIHPPLYFLVEGGYLKLTSDASRVAYAPGDIFAWVYHARYLNAILAGLTAAVFFLIGWRLRGPWLGLLLVAFFVLDPFALRTNRRAMLETLAGLLMIGGMGVLLTGLARYKQALSPGRAIAGGLVLGAALLAKELTFTALLAVFVYGVVEVFRGVRAARAGQPQSFSDSWAAFLTVLVAGATYALYPLWEVMGGQLAGFWGDKSLALRRLIGLVHTSGWNRAGVNLGEFLSQRLVDYGTTYIVLALGALAAIWLLVAYRHNRAGLLMGIWGAILYPFYAFVAKFGAGNDQFFYFLLLAAILLIATALVVLPESMGLLLARRRLVGSSLGRVEQSLIWTRNLVLLLFLSFLLSFNLVRWIINYGVGQDNGYRKAAAFVQAQVPPGAMINTSGDVIKFWYFFPDRPVVSLSTVQQAQALGVHYFALAPKDIWAHYSDMSPEMMSWIQSYGQQLYATSGDSYGPIYVYRVDYPPAPASKVSPPQPLHRTFGPAQGNWTTGLALALLAWFVLIVALGVWASRAAQPARQPVVLPAEDYAQLPLRSERERV